MITLLYNPVTYKFFGREIMTRYIFLALLAINCSVLAMVVPSQFDTNGLKKHYHVSTIIDSTNVALHPTLQDILKDTSYSKVAAKIVAHSAFKKIEQKIIDYVQGKREIFEKIYEFDEHGKLCSFTENRYYKITPQVNNTMSYTVKNGNISYTIDSNGNYEWQTQHGDIAYVFGNKSLGYKRKLGNTMYSFDSNGGCTLEAQHGKHTPGFNSTGQWTHVTKFTL